MIDAPLALAFASGMVAAVNPCGFAMLPAYVSFFLGMEGDREPSQRRANRLLGERAQHALETVGSRPDGAWSGARSA